MGKNDLLVLGIAVASIGAIAYYYFFMMKPAEDGEVVLDISAVDIAADTAVATIDGNDVTQAVKTATAIKLAAGEHQFQMAGVANDGVTPVDRHFAFMVKPKVRTRIMLNAAGDTDNAVVEEDIAPVSYLGHPDTRFY